MPELKKMRENARKKEIHLHHRQAPQERWTPKVKEHIKVLSRNILSIRFSIDRPRPPNWDPRYPLLITAYICQMQAHYVYIDNDSSTDILYEHYFRQLPTSRKEGLNPPTTSPLIGFIGHNRWPLGTIHLPLTLFSHGRKDKIAWIIEFSVNASQQSITFCSSDRCFSSYRPYFQQSTVSLSLAHLSG